MTEPDYIAIKLIGDDFFTWYDRSTFPVSEPSIPPSIAASRCTVTTFHGTGKFVTRNDGAVAEVWEPMQ